MACISGTRRGCPRRTRTGIVSRRFGPSAKGKTTGKVDTHGGYCCADDPQQEEDEEPDGLSREGGNPPVFGGLCDDVNAASDEEDTDVSGGNEGRGLA
jgi:hypothetical protein